MASSQQSRVLRCCSCRLFQAHQVTISLKWTCKACGKKQSFLRAYGEGSGADCRRHVQKLNLLQGQVSEMALRSLEEAGQPAGEENTASQQTEHPSLQGGLQPSESRWLKYLREDTADRLEPDGECLQTEQPGRPFSKDLPRKRAM
ncbi:MRN complex-interacting protein isoform X2 [Erinaceus europaeus]|uniref:MRN complex-interacting protein isoform X2 n=1 Tax=Erinaceus europaeus TaxID=9365 RepID=A0ABM3XWY0_ERIEU|nr:MRN complex-interacting protein isoform X2 [Erinaceus europaeus]